MALASAFCMSSRRWRCSSDVAVVETGMDKRDGDVGCCFVVQGVTNTMVCGSNRN